MALLKKTAAAKKAAPASGKWLAVKPAAKRTALRKNPVVFSHEAAPHVSVITAGGYTVFGSPVQPAHLTTEQITQAIADLD